MGAWGTGIYSDDVTCDIKTEFEEKMRDKKTTEEATAELIDDNKDLIADENDGPLFWIALADTQWRLGRLLPFVKENAIAAIDSGTDQKRWAEEDEKLGERRGKVLEKLRAKLLSPQPPLKSLRRSNKPGYITPWEDGDVFAFQITLEYSYSASITDTWIVFQKIGEIDWQITPTGRVHREPIIICRYSESKEMPTLEKFPEYKFSIMGLRMHRLKLYAFPLEIRSADEIPKKWIYLGNTEILRPKDEAFTVRKKAGFYENPDRLESRCIGNYFSEALEAEWLKKLNN